MKVSPKEENPEEECYVQKCPEIPLQELYFKKNEKKKNMKGIINLILSVLTRFIMSLEE